MDLETERRFLTVNPIWRGMIDPSLNQMIRQAYPDSLQAPGEFNRIRETLMPDGKMVYEFGKKLEACGISTPEAERKAAEAEAERHFAEADKNWLYKGRGFYKPLPGVTFMCDEFKTIRGKRAVRQPGGTLLTITEIEFTGDAAATAADYTPPSWVGREITGQHQWSNYSLCREGIPTR